MVRMTPALFLPPVRGSRGRRFTACLFGAVLLPGALAQTEFPVTYEWDIELLSMDLNATAFLPLGPGWDDPPILTQIHIGESAALASKGKAYAGPFAPAAASVASAAAAAQPPQPGEQFFVQSFFDVFFDITVTDVDPSVNFGGGPTDGVSLTFPDNGPAHMQNFYFAPYDPAAPNFGLIPPPESAPYIGHFSIEIPLGADLNGNGENDKIKFTLVTHAVGDENRTFVQLPDGTVIDSFDSRADLSGAVVDASQDPPFGITLTGPTTASSKLVPEPADAGVLASLGLLAFAGRRRRARG